jgi:hypothetical protein
MSLGILGARPALGLDSTPECKALQQRINAILKPAGYLPIGEDGKCGAGTCGAVKEIEEKLQPGFKSNLDYIVAPGLCPAFTAPKKAVTGGGNFPSSAPLVPDTHQAGFLGMDMNTLLLIGAIGVGAYVFFGKKKPAKAA